MGAWQHWVSVGLCLGGVAIACGGGGSDGDGSCQTGSERCACYANLTCDSGLICLSDVCVDEDDEGDGGSNGSGGSGGSGSDAGGSSSDSGGSSSGGSSDSGGSSSDSGGSSSDSGGSSSDSGGSSSDSGGSAGDSAGGAGSSGGSDSGSTTTAGGAGGAQGGSSGTGGGGSGGSGGTGGPIEGNLIQNGSFSDGNAHWLLTWGTYPGLVSFENGEYCVENTNYYYLTFTLGYPYELADTFPIASGASYTLRYRVKGYATYEVKIGQAVEPYTELVSVIVTAAGSSSYENEIHELTGVVSDPQAGLALNGFLSAGDYLCFDDISLVEE